MLQEIYSEVEEIKEAYRIYNDAHADLETRLNALSREKFLRDQLTEKAISFEEGEAKGKAERSFEIASNLKEDGFSADRISKLTGISINEIEKL